MSLQFDEGTYTVSQQMDSIRLLAKEFALLHFLYENKDKAFTRSQLLDRVWPLEYPVERTVDDHIYRLRKKLKRWDEVSLDTVRGYGYRLALRENRAVLPRIRLSMIPRCRKLCMDCFGNIICSAKGIQSRC